MLNAMIYGLINAMKRVGKFSVSLNTFHISQPFNVSFISILILL